MSDAFAKPDDSSGAGAQLRQSRPAGNRLAAEQSLYLQQHAHNPVDWYPWGEEALQRARAEDKPIFLSIGYSSCHWCHVMENEVFERDDVAAFLNEHFIAIKVDREERPDLDAVYMQALQMMTGSGGWPLNVLLTSDLRPFFGATYVPAEQFLEAARALSEAYAGDRAKVDEVGAELHKLVAGDPTPDGAAAALSPELPAQAAAGASLAFDEEWGGFGHRQKFPVPPRWRFLLHHYRLTGDAEVGRMLHLTLNRMGDGGIHDHVGGGFHRYTVERSWTVPHFEKMLYDNAQLASLYSEAAVVFKDANYGLIARGALDFMLDELADPAGGFYASFDADSDGEEGSFYVWTPAELRIAAGPAAGDALAALLGVTAEGNFEGASVLTRRASLIELEQRLGIGEDKLAGLLDKWRPALKEHRAQRVAPALDRKIVTAWNGLALEALALGHSVFGEERYREAAQRTADFLWESHRREDGGLWRASTAGQVSGEGILDDYALLALGLLALFEATGDAVQLKRALMLIDYAVEHFAHPRAGFYLTPAEHEAPLGRQVVIHDSVEPSGSAAMLLALQRAAAITGREDYRAKVTDALSTYADTLATDGLELAAWQDVALLELSPLYTVVIAGDGKSAATRELLTAAREQAAPYALVVHLPVAGASQELAALAPALADKRAADDGTPRAYVCRYGSCQAPTADPAEMLAQLGAGWLH